MLLPLQLRFRAYAPEVQSQIEREEAIWYPNFHRRKRKRGEHNMTSEFNIAVHSLVYLANHPERMATSETIAANICTHPTRVRKVLALLRKNKYISAKEGAGGGFFLDCDPDKVTLAELYTLTSKGTLKPAWKSGNPESPCGCKVTVNIGTVMDEIYQEAERYFEKSLENLTISSVLKKIREAKSEKMCGE